MKRVFALLVAVFLLVVPVYAVPVDDVPIGLSNIEEAPLVPGEPVPEGELDISGGVTLYADTVVLSEVPSTYAITSSPIAGGCFMEVSSSIGDMKIYVPANYQYGTFSYFNGGNVCGIISSTITGYGFKGSTVYQIRFAPFSDPQYRLYDSSYSYTDFSITDVIATNVQILSSDDELPLYPDSEQLQLIIIALLGGVFVCRLLKR